ncbi:uncharacterized protein LOC133201025 [Saccostrea echinata]|uniref:uncharacterized protein LOC133201025 n=1 Tax=Saccostrea echinata TaxID=191078 RepID=UPI002A822382|nr:uncharacterized protein LOC133201025 [Saccostrea echinata]
MSPVVEVSSCTQSQLVITLTGASDTGTVYIQGRTAACQQTTSSVGTVSHTFLFSSCGLQWEESFKIIVQKNALYQTGEDKQIPVMCITDLSDIEVTNNLNALDKDDDTGKNLTVKPTATMTLYSNGLDVGGGNVKLTDAITMGLQLGADFVSDFDILASSCTASGISIITDSCAPDTALFPNFAKPLQGYLAATFGAFRTTSLDGGSVAMTFSCTLKVCLGTCSPVRSLMS